MFKKIKSLSSKMSVNVIAFIIFILVFFGVLVSLIGFYSFTTAFKKEYASSTYHMADTATTLVNGDHLADYLDGKYEEEYAQMHDRLDAYCQKMSVSLVYVICVDQSDYGRFVSVVNLVNNAVDNTEYSPWELGHKRDTTNDEYRLKYRRLYEKETLHETLYRIKTTDGQHPHITTMVSVRDSADNVVGILCIQRPARELSKARKPYLISIALSTFLLSVISVITATSFVNKSVIRPIKKVSKEATRFAKENTKGEPFGKISKYREITNLANSIETMETDMVNYVNNITAITAEKERIGAELSFAKTIQENSIPNIYPAFPDREDFDIYASMTPAKEVGGDFYNFFLIDEDHLAMVIGDVSGKSVPAALFMMVTNILLTERAHVDNRPSDVLSFVNDRICERNEANMFVTIWFGVLELSTGIITAVNAGHEDEIIYRKNGSFERQKKKHNIAIGIMPGVKYTDIEFQLEKGDKLFVYTDGAPEATNSEDKMYGVERLVESLNVYRKDSPRQIIENVHKRINEFVGNAPQFDDLTMLCLELKK